MAGLSIVPKFFFKSNTSYVICFTFLVTLMVYFFCIKSDSSSSTIQKTPERSSSSTIQKTPQHCLCVLVPCRNVFDELLEFIPLMNEFLNRQSIKFHFVVLNHVLDGHRFNKGAIINAGYKIISKYYVDCDYMALHDIDLIPLNDNITYTYPGQHVYHVASPEYHPFGQTYPLESLYNGGVVIISNEQYLRMNGFGNHFWGWAWVDMNFSFRMGNNLIGRIRPTGLATNRSNTFKHIHSPYRVRDVTVWMDPKSRGLLLTDFESGIKDVKYNLISVRSIKFDEIPLIMFSMSVPCDYSLTPWSIVQERTEHGLCVLVPCRNVFDELLEFIPIMNEFLKRQSIKFHFIVVNQVPDGHRFNKGAILNAGFKIISEKNIDCDYLALHDVDLITLNDNISYAYPGDDAYHVSSAKYHPLGLFYNDTAFFGGIVLISNKQYLCMNGFGNHFWGWAWIDLNFYYRAKNNSINIVRPSNLTTHRKNTFKKIHSPHRKRDGEAHKYQDNRVVLETDFESGINDVQYNLISVRPMKINQIPLTMLSLSIPCNYSLTPWCKVYC